MAYASRAGRAKTSVTDPRAHAICDRCGFRYNFQDLNWQFDWRGAMLQNLRILVCDRCLDTPDEQLRAIILPADPMPIVNARVEPFSADEGANFPVASGQVDARTGIPKLNFGTTIQSGPNTITYQPIGNPTGLEINGQMPLVENVVWGQTLQVLSMISTGTAQVNVTTSVAHGLSTNSQVGIEGVTPANKLASGIFSVVVTSATAFYYLTYSAIPAGSLLTNTTLVKTCNVGLPYGVTTVPVISPS